MTRNLISKIAISPVFPWEVVGERCIEQLAVLFSEDGNRSFLCVVQHLTDSRKFLFPWNSKSWNLELLMWFFQVAHACTHKMNVMFLAGWEVKKKDSQEGVGEKKKESSIPTSLPLCCSPKIQIPVWPEMKLIALQEECGNNGLRTLWMNYALQARGSSAHRCPKFYFYVSDI